MPQPTMANKAAVPRSGWASASSGRHADHDQRRNHRIGAPDPLRRQPLIVAGERDHERDLHDLRRLEAVFAEADPALRAAALDADDRNQDEQEEDGKVERIGEAQPPAEVRDGDGEQKRKPKAVAHDVPARPGLERAAGDRIERGHADQGDGGDQQQERPVDEEQLLAELELPPLGALLEHHAHRPAPASATAEAAPMSLLATKAGLLTGSRSRSSVMTSRTIGAAVSAPQPPCSTTQATA